MRLEHIELKDLKPCPLNVRKHGANDIGDLVASIRSLGIIQPLLVRPNCEGFEVVAGQRRLKAAQTIYEQDSDFAPVPCAILEDGDDALALEASLAENIARLPMDEIDQYEAFAALIASGKSVEDIASDFGVTELLVKKRLAIAGLIKPILNAYRKEEIDAQIIRILTLATKKQQKEWFALFRDHEQRAPRGHQLKAWLFGGAEIPVSNALFDLADYKGAIKGDLFDDEQYFTDTTKFWECQNKAIAAKMEEYQAAGWSDVIVLEVGSPFHSYYGYEQRPKKDGGKVFIACSAGGEVECNEGWLEQKEARQRDLAKAKADGSYEPPIRPELTKAAQTYLDLHRHAAVRTELLKQPQLALRLMVAHALCGSSLWNVKSAPQNSGRNEAIDKSIEGAKAQKAFVKERLAVCKLLGIKGGKQNLCNRCTWEGEKPLDFQATFAKLCDLTDKQVMRILSYTMAETLASGTELIDDLGTTIGVDMGGWWTPDNAFYDLLRDKQMINAMLKEIASKAVADGNVTSTAKVQKNIIRDFAEGNEGRKKAEGWLPRFMQFPQRTYLKRS